MVLALRRSVVLLAFVALTGCGVLKHEAGRPAVVTQNDLARMVVPQKDLGADVAALKLDAEHSGEVSAQEAAENTTNPKDSARSLRRAGWVSGFELNYSDPSRRALAKRSGLILTGTTVDLFETDSAARELLVKEVADMKRFAGKRLDGVKLEKVRTFDVSVGDEAWGLVYTIGVGKFHLRATSVYFRRGRLLGTSGYLRPDDTVVRAAAIKAARALDDRIQRTLAGEKLAPALQPSQHVDAPSLALTNADLPGRGRLMSEGEEPSSGHPTYFRQFDLGELNLNGSTVLSVRSEVQLYKTPRSAAVAGRLLSGARGTKFLTAAFAKGVSGAGFKVRNLRARKLRVGGFRAVDLTLDSPRGRFETVMFVVRVKRAVHVVGVYGFDRELDPADVVFFAERARARMYRELG
jgi:hypothetical protein